MKRLLIGLTGALVSLGLVSADLGDYGGCGVGMMYGNYGTGAALFSWFFMGLVAVALIVFIIWMIKQIQKNKK